MCIRKDCPSEICNGEFRPPASPTLLLPTQRARRQLAMAAAVRSNSSMNPRKSKRQKKCRRKTTLMKKAFEYSKMCGADVCIGIRLRETGQVHILTADDSGFWAFIASQLVCYELLPPRKK